MSILFDTINIPDGWSKAYFSQLAGYVRERDRDGYYYGNKEQYEKRHKAILEWIEAIEENLHSSNDYKFKKATTHKTF